MKLYPTVAAGRPPITCRRCGALVALRAGTPDPSRGVLVVAGVCPEGHVYADEQPLPVPPFAPPTVAPHAETRR